MQTRPNPTYSINSSAPIQICDNGGWTDTWFSEYGEIFNIAVSPLIEIQIDVFPDRTRNRGIILNVQNFSDRYVYFPANQKSTGKWGKHPLLEATIEYMEVPDNLDLEITVHSLAPSGASTGTSAAVTVALIGALNQLKPSRMNLSEIAAAAQKVETEILEQQCGIQDQICATYGGINYIQMDNYPHAQVFPLLLKNNTWSELERRLVLIYLGKSHKSSEVHKMVIQYLEDSGPENKQLRDLRKTARRSRDALLKGDFHELGKAMIENTEVQGRLHPDLISADSSRVIEIASEFGALGWKINGAGGEGGSLTILSGPDLQEKYAMIHAIEGHNPSFSNIPINLSKDGLQVWETRIHR